MGFRNPRHHAKDKGAAAAFKKILGDRGGDSRRGSWQAEGGQPALCGGPESEIAEPPHMQMQSTINIDPVIHLAIELSASTWLVASKLPTSEKIGLHRVEAGDSGALLALIADLRKKEPCGGANEHLGEPARQNRSARCSGAIAYPGRPRQGRP